MEVSETPLPAYVYIVRINACVYVLRDRAYKVTNVCVNACVPGSARPRSTNPSQSSHTHPYPSHPVKLHSHTRLSYLTTVLPYHKLSP